nr:hypothetical protein [Tanacetum cinerariifolium]
MMDNEVGVTSPESTTQTLSSFEEYTPPVTYLEEVEKMEVPSFDEPEPQPLLNNPSLDGFVLLLSPMRKKHYGFKPCLLGHSGSLGVDFLKLKMIDDDWGLESKEVYFIGRGLNSPIWPKEVEKVCIKETHHLEHIIQQLIFQHEIPSHNNGVFRYYHLHLNSSVEEPSPLSAK